VGGLKRKPLEGASERTIIFGAAHALRVACGMDFAVELTVEY
jgi:hypothetical protein